MNTGKKYRGRGIFPPSTFFSPYTRLCLFVFRRDALLFGILTGRVYLMVRGLSRQGEKLPLFLKAGCGPNPEKSSQHQLACDFQEPAAVSQATLEPAILR